MWGLIFGICLTTIAIGLRVDGKVGDKAFVALLCVAVVSGFLIERIAVTRRFKAGPFELETFRKDVNETKEEALEEIKKEVAVQKEAISSLINKANETREALLKVADMASPPLLSLESQEIKQIGEDYIVKLEFKPSKNVPFGYLCFRAEIVGNSQASIKKLNPYDMHTVGQPGLISDDGKTATLWYMPMGSLWQRIALYLSSSCKVRISCSHMQKDLELEVK